jgi:hypothetical protein
VGGWHYRLAYRIHHCWVEEEVMQKLHVPQTRVPGAQRRINPDTLLIMFDEKGYPLWNMPAPVRYAEHRKRTGKRTAEPVMVPLYRGTSASYARWVKSQLRRSHRKAAEMQAAEDAQSEENKISLQEAEAALEDLVLNPGGHNVEA